MVFRPSVLSICLVSGFAQRCSHLVGLTGMALLLVVVLTHHQLGWPVRSSQKSRPAQVRYKINTLKFDLPKLSRVESRPRALKKPVKHFKGALKYQSPYVQRRLAERRLHALIVAVADRHGLDPALIKAIIRAESDFKVDAVSSKGAEGLMQLMPRTAQSLGVKNSFNPASNIEGGARYMRYLLDRFKGDLQLALAAYNAGSRHVTRYRGIPPFKSTRRYVQKVIGYYHRYKSPSA